MPLRFRLTHGIQIDYTAPVLSSRNETRLRPRDDASQACLTFELTTDPPSHPVARQDTFRNVIHAFDVQAQHTRLEIRTEAEIELPLLVAPPPATVLLADLNHLQASLSAVHGEFLSPSMLVPHLPEISNLAAAAEQVCNGTVQSFVTAANEMVHRDYRYTRGATGVNTTLHDIIAKRVGVCQDFAHLLLAVVRTRGLPARYVSGYLLPESLLNLNVRAPEFARVPAHAWVEVFFPEAGWAAFDPTIGKPGADRHIRLAYGRDYNDVAPFRGKYTGSAESRLSVEIRINRQHPPSC